MAPLLPVAWVVLTHASPGLGSGAGDAQFPNPVAIEHEGEAAGAAVIVALPIGVEASPVVCLGHASDGHPSLGGDELPIAPAADGLVRDKAAPLVVDGAVLREERPRAPASGQRRRPGFSLRARPVSTAGDACWVSSRLTPALRSGSAVGSMGSITRRKPGGHQRASRLACAPAGRGRTVRSCTFAPTLEGQWSPRRSL